MDTGESTIETSGTTEPVVGGMDKDTRMWAMILHFSTLAVFVLPVVGLIAPIVIWQIKKEEMPAIGKHSPNMW